MATMQHRAKAGGSHRTAPLLLTDVESQSDSISYELKDHSTFFGTLRRQCRKFQSLPRSRFLATVLVATLGMSFGLAWVAWKSMQSRGTFKQALPLPSQETRVSVVIMNHNRPRMVKESLLMKTLTGHPLVDEILLCHSNPTTMFHFEHEKVKNIDATTANQQRGLSLRFYFCRTARNQWVIHVDDDMEFSADVISALIAEFSKDTHRIVGHFGREFSPWRAYRRNGYDTRNIFGPVEVVLTKLLIMERSMCANFFSYESLVEDLLPQSVPLWNGEDIFMNLVANRLYGVSPHGPYKNLAMRNLLVQEASDDLKDDDSGAKDISGNMNRHRWWNVGFARWREASQRAQQHAAYRGRLWSTAKQRLAEQVISLN